MEEDTQKEVVQNREGKLDDYILVKFMPLKSKDPMHYVGTIIEPETDDVNMSSLFYFIASLERCQGNLLHQ